MLMHRTLSVLMHCLLLMLMHRTLLMLMHRTLSVLALPVLMHRRLPVLHHALPVHVASTRPKRRRRPNHYRSVPEPTSSVRLV